MVEINIKNDGMIAEMKLFPEKDEMLSIEYLKEMLYLEGIQAGIKESALEELVKKKRYGVSTTVAVGRDAVDGEDGYYDYFFVTEEESKGPRILEDGSVDYTMSFTNVVEGDLVAEYHQRTTGTYGYNVYAAMIPPKVGKELRPLRCKGVRIDENRYYAEKPGLVTKRGNQLVILDILDINGDVDQTVGNLEFNGDIRVHGSILANLSVSAKGSVIVDGVVESAYVKAEKDIYIAKGVHGQGSGRLEADENVFATFIDHGFVHAGGNVDIDYTVGSFVEAEGRVKAEGHYGSIVGGIITAVGGVEVGTLGNYVGINTQIYAGINNKMRKEMDSLLLQLQKLRDAKEACHIASDVRAHVEMIDDVRSRIMELEEKQRSCIAAPIIVNERIYPGAKCYLSGVMAPNLLGRRGFELRNIRYSVVCRKTGTFSLGEIESGSRNEDDDKKPKLLIIDDEASVLNSISDMLWGGYRVFTAQGGGKARIFLEKNSVDLILLDYKMPGEGGAEVLKNLRKNKDTKDVPVLFMTDPEDRNKIMDCLELRPAGYVIKPIDNLALQDKIKAALYAD